MIINSILDQDLYSFTVQRAILAYKQNVPVEYRFINRRPEGKFNQAFEKWFKSELNQMGQLYASPSEIEFLGKACPFLGQEYLEYLRNFRFDPSQVNFFITNGELELKINGPWESTILWEVPLMALISECFFTHCDTSHICTDWQLQEKQLVEKSNTLASTNCRYADFGTRRRRNYRTQDLVVKTLRKEYEFVGTSNVHFAQKYGVKPIGTMSHQWPMGISKLESLRHANRYALQIWNKVYKGNLGIALSDTFGSDAFFEDFDAELSRLFDGVRQDSGDPMEFAEKTIRHYQKLGIDPMTKTIVFSDGLTAIKTSAINEKLSGRIKTSFGIGTHLTNDYHESPALNMVIKLYSVDGVPVVKLSDTLTKAMGDRDALRVANWVFLGKPLDEK